ncbi:MAG TPA: hypothetical protein VN735_08645 [Steroidobacteraceae bacterium]|nr:hypothetical protein [Steroidobacteraceae bacterium]
MIEPHTPADSAPEPGRSGRVADEAQREKIQKQLDEALADSFPASDPVSIVTSNEEEDWGKPKSQAGD